MSKESDAERRRAWRRNPEQYKEELRRAKARRKAYKRLKDENLRKWRQYYWLALQEMEDR